ncbi:hypothetical protein QKU48_gp0704 [Fadolivirus algeromassiliense]|jgi:hypothetical protein|uniref:Uncharacterized protein n=1 Tax=Fadolivirus FV1/VV64 TaxID=3070911 RepID=A0A7D3R127_9VIRU|nr:hypothetical protein QKU48_gp0704 [Fadolivirus algeromassiliense]QKF94162.1 hypothetical protein Fadolivirus_1_704 [Fadolivirus FV1/VV64]
MSFIKRLHDIETHRCNIIDIIKSLGPDIGSITLDKTPPEIMTQIIKMPPEIVYKLSNTIFKREEHNNINPLRFHYLNVFDETVDIDTLKRGIDILIDYDYYGIMDQETIIQFIKPLSDINKIRFVMKGEELSKEYDDIKTNISNRIQNESLDNFSDLMTLLSDKPKYQYHIMFTLQQTGAIESSELLRYHEFNIFEDSTSYDIVREWIELMKEYYYYVHNIDKMVQFCKKLNENEKNKVIEFYDQFLINELSDVLHKISI